MTDSNVRSNVGLVCSAMRATNVLILVCIVATLYALTTSTTNVENNLVFSLKNLQEGRLWTLVTAIFVHASLLHLLGNMIFLYVFGNTLESVTSSKHMLAVFFTGGLLSFPLSLPFFPAGSTFVGASAAIFTLAAVVMLLKPLRFSWLLLMPVGLVAILYFLYNAVTVYFQAGGQSDVAYISHVIGFMLGVPFGLAWSPNWKKNLAISIALLICYFVILTLVTQYVLPKLKL